MSSLLNHIDNNRSEDEDDHINRLFAVTFLKCKPRASSLSLSPSLQHMSHVSTISSTSASDLCLTSLDYPNHTTPNQNTLQNSNYNRNIKNCSRNNKCNTRRHSSHSHNNIKHYNKDSITLTKNCWRQSENKFDQVSFEQICNEPYDNNNVEYQTKDLNSLSSNLKNNSTSVGNSSIENTPKQPNTNQHNKFENHNFQQKNGSRSLKGNRKLVESQEIPVSYQHQRKNPIFCDNPAFHTSSDISNFDKNGHDNRVNLHSKPPSTVISSQSKKKSISGGQFDKREDKVQSSKKDTVTKTFSHSTSIVSESLIAMECNGIDDNNFDNGIGSGCSRSSGESSHSHTSDLMENLVSPTQSIRSSGGIPGNSAGGGNGFPATSVLTPSSIGSLRDSRIEIAGGREVYSQNRIRASRRHRGSSYTTSSCEIMAEQANNTVSISSSKMRKKSLHSHSAYQHPHCCHNNTNSCCGSTSSCQEVSLPPLGPLVWELNHSCRRSVDAPSGRQQYLSHSHSLGGPNQHCVKSTPHGCGCCGHQGFDYPSTFPTEFELGGGIGSNRIGRNLPLLQGTGPSSPLTMRETVFASEVRSIEKSNLGVSQVQEKSNEIGSPCQVEPVIYEAVVGDGKVVFDDIGEWRERHKDVENPVECGYDGGDEHDLNESRAIRKRQMQSSHSISTGIEDECIKTNADIPRSKSFGFVANNVVDLIEGSPCASNRDGNTTPSGYESDECSASAIANNSILPPSIPITKTSPHFGNKRVIGNIPIADYEGSPKRYGLKQSSHAVSSHFDLGSVEMGIDEHPEGHNLIEHEAKTQSLIDQTIAAATSSSSSSLDNTNTNVSSNSSSRTNNRVSPRALSPSQPISGLTTNRFPGFPQRISSNDSSVNNDTFIQTSPSCDSPKTKIQSFGKREDLKISSGKENSFNCELRSNNNKVISSSVVTSNALSYESNIGQGSVNIDVTKYSHGEGLVDPNSQSNSDLEVHCSRNVHIKGELESNLVYTHGADASSITTRSQDLLYEFSETRKVLEEFFNASGNPNGENPRADKASFDELDYTLKRQTGNSLVGQRLAGDGPGNVISEDSPKKPPRRGVLLLGTDGEGDDEKGSPKLISFQEISLPQMHSLSPSSHHQQRLSHMQSHSLVTSNRSPRSLKSHSRSQSQSPPPHDPTRDINDNDIDVETASTNTETDLGDTEVGMQVGNNRHFTLSPETTDCDSNELESELSLDYEASVHSSRVGVTMPVVEDGLSSGNESENEEIMEVDIGYRDENFYLNDSKLNCSARSPSFNSKLETDIGNVTKLALLKSNNEYGNPFFSMEGIPTSLLDWNIPDSSLSLENDIKALSENNSNESNPTVMLMKKQISEIEKEIQLRASQQCQRIQQTQIDSLIEKDFDLNLSLRGSNELQSPKNQEVNFSDSRDSISVNTFSTARANGSFQPSNTGAKGPLYSKVNQLSETGNSDNPVFVPHDPELDALDPMRPTPPPSPAPGSIVRQQTSQQTERSWTGQDCSGQPSSFLAPTSQSSGINFDRMEDLPKTSSSPSTTKSGGSIESSSPPSVTVAAAIQDIKEAIQRTKPLPQQRQPDQLTQNPLSSTSSLPLTSTSNVSHHSRVGLRDTHQYPQHSMSQERAAPLICDSSPVWIPRHTNSGRMVDRSDNSGVRDSLLTKQRYEDTGDDDADTDQETDRLLGQTRTEDDYGFYDEKDWKKTKSRSLLPAINKGVAFVKSAASVPSQAPLLSTSASSLSNIVPSTGVTNSSSNFSSSNTNNSNSNANNHSSALVPSTSTPNFSSQHSVLSKSLSPTTPFDESQVQLPSSAGSSVASKSKKEKDGGKKKRSKEDILDNPSVLIEGVLFRARYLGSTQLVCEGQQPTKATRMMQAEEAVSRIKAQPGQNGTVSQGTNEVVQKGSSTVIAASTNSPLPPILTNLDSTIVRSSVETNFECLSNQPKKMEDITGDVDDYVYQEDEDSCCDDDESLDEGDGDEDLKSPHLSIGSASSLRETKTMRLPFEDIHGSSNALQIHDNHTHPISLHHNRQQGGGSCEAFPGTVHSPFLHISPPFGSALPGTMFRLRFIGSLEVDEEIGTGKRRRKRPKKTMVEEAVGKMKAPEGETQPSTEVDLFISTEKIMVLNTDLKEIMMDHALRTISYIADIGDLVVLMARRRPVPTDTVDESKPPRLPKMICHVFESDEAQYIAQSIGQAFQVAYMEFLKANGIEDSSFVREMDYQEVLNSQEIFGDELQMFAKKELQKEVVVPKTKGEILGVVIVESGWGSMLPTVVIANLAAAGAAARCGHLNIGDQIIAINGVSLVGLPLSTCQNYIKNTKTQTVVKLTVVPCPPVVEVKIKRPDTKYQLGFSVQNGVICSLLRGGIAERGGVRVGHRIIEINNQSVVAVPHEKIVNLLATSVGEINMKTMPTSMFRLLTGQETPLYI